MRDCYIVSECCRSKLVIEIRKILHFLAYKRRWIVVLWHYSKKGAFDYSRNTEAATCAICGHFRYCAA